MLFRIFLDQQWKEYTRSSVWQRNLITNIIIGFFLMLMMLYLIMLGIFIDPVLRKMFPDDDPVLIFNGIIIYYLGFDLLIRYIMQALPTFAIESYLHLPVKKRTIVHFVIAKSVFHVLNFLPLLVFLPFAYVSVSPVNSGLSTFSWIIAIFFLILNNNFLSTYLKRQLVSKPLITLAAGIILITLAVLDHFDVIKLSGISTIIFTSFLKNPIYTLIPILLVLLSYILNFFLLKNRMYPDEVIKRKSVEIQDIPRIKYLNSMGLTGDLIMLDMRLWIRNKRTKSLLYMLPIFLLYGFMFYPENHSKPEMIYIFVGIFMTGGMTMNYFMYAFGYASSHFDGILTSRIEMERFIRAKLTIGMLFSTLCYIITVPYILYGSEILLFNTAAYLFNIGVSSYAILFMATYNKKRIELGKGATFNYQGVSALNWIIPFPVFFLPVIIFAIFSSMGNKYLGLVVLCLMGIIGLLSRKILVKVIVNNFYKRKYAMAEGFREGG
jgi:hypothetical protein